MKVAWPKKRHFISITILICCIIAGVFVVISTRTQPSQAPTYTALLPVQKSISDLGGWTRVSPPDKDPVFAYRDTIDGTAVTVSQQQLPASFKGDTANQVADIAKKFNATSQLDINGTTVYIGTSAKGPQSAIFAKRDLLILIKSQKTMSDAAWSTYITSLQ